MLDLGTPEMIRPTGGDPIAVISGVDPSDFHVGDKVRINGQQCRVTRIVDMTKVGVPKPWVGLMICVLPDKE